MKLINKKDEFVLEINELNYQLDNDELKKLLLNPNYENEDSPFVFVMNEGEEELPIFDTIQVKINIKDVGELLVNFHKETFDKEARKQLLNNLSTLKEIDVNEEGNLNKKLSSVYDFLKELPIYYAIFSIKHRFNEVEEIIKLNSLVFLTIYTNDEIIEEIKEEPINNENEKASEEVATQENEKNPENQFKLLFKRFKKEYSKHIINLVYSLLLAMVATFASVFFIQKDVGYGFLFVAFILAFIGLLSYDYYELKNSYQKYHPLDLVLLAVETIIAFSLGILLSSALIKGLLKFDNPVDYKKLILVSSIVVIGSSLVIHLVAFALLKILPIIAEKRKAKKEKTEDQ